MELVESAKPDVVVLDLGLPDISGYDVLKEIRAFSDVPLVILTVRGEEADITRGLEGGADEYITKPFRQMELLSRIRALLRRANRSVSEKPLVSGNLTFNVKTRQVLYKQKEIDLTRTESIILHELMKNAGQVVTYTRLAEAIWGDDYPDAVESLRVYISRIREKIETDSETQELIITKPGIGYILTTQK